MKIIILEHLILKLKYLTFNQLDRLSSAVTSGMSVVCMMNGIMEKFAKAYGYIGDNYDGT